MFEKRLAASVVLAAVVLFATGRLLAGELPAWVKQVIVEKEASQVENPPGFIVKCSYQNRDVYYISSGCCDQYSHLYDVEHVEICAPDGGFTGRGDGRCPNYLSEKKDCETVWQDTRTWPPKGKSAANNTGDKSGKSGD